MKPTQDKSAIQEIDAAIRKQCDFDYDGYCVGFSPDGMATEIMGILERRGYQIPHNDIFSVSELESVLHPHKEEKPNRIEIDNVSRIVRNLDTGEAHEY